MQRSLKPVGDQRPESHEISIGEVDDSEDRVDDGDARCADREHRTRNEAVRDELPEHQTSCRSGTRRFSANRSAPSVVSAGSGGAPITAPATIRATAGANMNPGPLKPAATNKPPL